MFTYEWDGENRMTAMEMRPTACVPGEFDVPYRLEFSYDAMGRRVRKQYLTFPGAHADLETLSGPIKIWDSNFDMRFVYDGPRSWNLSASYYVDPTNGAFQGAVNCCAWGPDLSGTEQGAGGIGGLAIITDCTTAIRITGVALWHGWVERTPGVGR